MVRAANGTVLAAVGRVYGIPLILGMLSAIFTLMLTHNELFAFVAMLVGLGAGFFALGRRVQGRINGEPVLTLAFKARS
jgi:positive regulator of sigma E activity